MGGRWNGVPVLPLRMPRFGTLTYELNCSAKMRGETPEEGAAAMATLLDGNVLAVVSGGYTTWVDAQAAVTPNSGVPLLAIATLGRFDEVGSTRPVFRMAQGLGIRGQQLGEFAVNGLDARTAVVIVGTADPYGFVPELMAGFRSAFTGAGGAIICEKPWDSESDSETDGLASALHALEADVIVVADRNLSHRPLLSLVKGARVQGVDAPFLSRLSTGRSPLCQND